PGRAPAATRVPYTTLFRSPPHGPGRPAGARLGGSDPLADLSERGRGLLLVDHFASVWGTTHQGTRKGVWFRLDRDGSRGGSAAGDRKSTRLNSSHVKISYA